VNAQKSMITRAMIPDTFAGDGASVAKDMGVCTC
jgi:hypothetical protein